MAEFIHSIFEANQAISNDGDVTYDLPVNPMSVILIHISPLNNTGSLPDYALLEGLLSAIDNIRITHKGSAIINASGVDLAALALLYHRIAIWQSNAVETNNDRRSLVLPLLFGRKPYMANECFPATRRGEFQMTITWDIADTGFDGLRMSIETIELLDVTPEWVQKTTTLSQTFAATGDNDLDLPIGNAIRAILMFGTTAFAGASPAPSLGALEVLVDNKTRGYSATDFEVSRAVLGLAARPFPPDFRHIHSVNAAGAGDEDVREPEIGSSLDDNYTLLDFDPTMDDLYILETANAARVNVRINAETADAVRAIPIERVAAANFGG